MSILPLQLSWDKASTRWSSILNPVINNPLATPTILSNVSLVAGKNVINHRLGQPLTGWIPTRVRSAATFYDDQSNNQTPQLTLILYASAACVVDLAVF